MECRWLTDLSRQFLERDYLLPGQTVENRIDVISKRAEEILKIEGFANKFKQYLCLGWYSLSTPIWTNFGNNRGLPISCYGSDIQDNITSILATQSEVGMMTKNGGGTSAYFGKIRGRGEPITNNGKTSGSVHFMQLYDNTIKIISQGSSRRGQFAAYQEIEHIDIEEFLQIRHEGHPIQDISTGICVSNDFMERMIGGDSKARWIWAKVLQSRINTGYPYIFFTDNVNKNKPDVYKNLNYRINASNLCSEICLPSNEEESFVCDLASQNILYYDEWKHSDATETLVLFLDAVMSEFIEKASRIKFLEKAVRFAQRHRALGIGWLGWHSYLQSKGIPFESTEAKRRNVEVARTIQIGAIRGSYRAAALYGEPELLKGYGRRNTTLTAIAPTKSSAFIIGQVSEGIEPHRANYYIKDLQKGKFTIKNKELEQLLELKGENTDEVWDSILQHAGSVQHLTFLSEHEKAVFKTFAEISPKEVIIQAAQRQKYIDQSQSLNLMIGPNIPIKDINALMIEAWQLEVKTLYYQLGVSAAQNFSRNILSCISCES